MLERVFSFLSKTFVTLLVLLLVLSFAVWGVGDVLRGSYKDIAATVGDAVITNPELRRAVNYEKERIEGIMNGTLNEELMKFFRVKERALMELVKQKLITQESYRLNFAISDQQVAHAIRNNPQFRKADGSFDSDAFRNFLRYTGLSESAFVEAQKQDQRSKALFDILADVPPLLDVGVEMLHGYEGEKRAVELMVLSNKMIANVPDPDEASLIAYYDQAKQQFSAPEYRSLQFIALTLDDVKEDIDVSEPRLQQLYSERIDEFRTPESRHLEQMVLPSKELADRAYKALSEGKVFRNISKRLTSEEAVDFGKTTKEDMLASGLLPESLVNEVFSLSKNGYSKPQETSLGWHIFQVIDITPETIQPFEKAKPTLQKTTLAEEGQDVLYRLATRLEDTIAGGATLEEAASALGLEVQKIGHINDEGKTLENEDAPHLDSYPNMLRLAFQLPENTISTLQSSEDGLHYFLLEVTNVIAERERALDEVRGAVFEGWKEKKRRELLEELAHKTAEKLKGWSKKAFKAEAEQKNAEIVSVSAFHRNDSDVEPLPEALIEEVFSLKRGDISAAYSRSDGTFVIAYLSEITPANPTDTEVGLLKVEQELEGQIVSELLSQYMVYLQRRYPVEYTQP